MNRRRLLLGSAACAATAMPLASLLTACGRGTASAGPVEVVWGRDTCTHCRMVISDRRFAAQVRGGPERAAFKFDDIGCAVSWLAAEGWDRDAATRVWVAAAGGRGETVEWLDARQAHYVAGPQSPMGYNFGAAAAQAGGSVGFEAMRSQVLAGGHPGPS